MVATPFLSIRVRLSDFPPSHPMTSHRQNSMPLIRPYDWRSFVRRPNFEPWSRRYLLHLSGLSRFDFPRLCAMACHSEGRLREPLLLYALQSDRFPELMAMTDDSELRGEYEHAADSLGELAPKTMRWSTATTLPPVTGTGRC